MCACAAGEHNEHTHTHTHYHSVTEYVNTMHGVSEVQERQLVGSCQSRQRRAATSQLHSPCSSLAFAWVSRAMSRPRPYPSRNRKSKCLAFYCARQMYHQPHPLPDASKRADWLLGSLPSYLHQRHGLSAAT